MNPLLVVLITVDNVLGAIDAHRLHQIGFWGAPTAAILVWSNTASIVAFAILLPAAIVLRRRPETHKRMMLLASISIIQPAFARIFRWPVFEAPGAEGIMLAVAAPFVLVGALIVYDLLSRKSLHPATVAGAAVFSG